MTNLKLLSKNIQRQPPRKVPVEVNVLKNSKLQGFSIKKDTVVSVFWGIFCVFFKKVILLNTCNELYLNI